jgi:alkylresorcinol/alkylpyrone synthase
MDGIDFRSGGARLLSLASAVPPHRMTQSDAAAMACKVFSGRFGNYERMAPVFETAGIRARYTVEPAEWYVSGQLGWPERMTAYLKGAEGLFIAAATRALDGAGISAADVDIIVTVSSTGIATPSLEARVASRLGFRADIERVPVFGLGCAGGVSGLALAARLAVARPGAVVLMVAVEVCTVAFRGDQPTKANIVASALFGDGAAACVLRAGEGGLAGVEGAGQHMWPDTLDIMGWDVDERGLEVIFDRAIPPFVAEKVRPALEGILGRLGIDVAEVDRFACHPGGAKVILALEQALRLPQGTLDHEREVLSDYGNMSAPTVIFVMERLLAAGLPSRTVMTAMGPGFSCSALSLAA